VKRFLAVFVLLALLAKPVGAFVGVPLLFAAPVIEAAGATFATWAALAAGVGATLFSVKLQDDSGNEFLRVRLNPNSPAYVPSGWTPAPNSYDDPLPPGTAAPVFSYGGGSTGVSPFVSSPAGACNSWLSGCQGGFCGGPYTLTSTANGTCSYTYPGCGSVCSGSGSYNTAVGCPTGYTFNGSTCNLTSAPSVAYPPDNRCGLKFSAGTMSYDSRDPDCASPSGTSPAVGQVNLSTDGKTLTVTNTAGTQRVQVAVQTDGSVKITTWTPSSTDPTTTTIQTATVSNPASTPKVTTTQQSVTNSTGSTAFTQTSSPGTSNDKPITFPDDYSREATQQAVLAKLGDVKTSVDNLTKAADAPADPVALTSDDINGVFFPDTFTTLHAWQMPARAVACPTWSFSVFSHSYTIDAHCALIENQRAFFSSIMLLVWSLAALFIVLGA
jgi:hypothetical protein